MSKTLGTFLTEDASSIYGKKTWHEIIFDFNVYLPLTARVIKRVFGDLHNRISGYHYCDLKNFLWLEKMQGGYKSVSITSSVPRSSVLGNMGLHGGVCVKLSGEGTYFLNMDAWTVVDEHGDRWAPIHADQEYGWQDSGKIQELVDSVKKLRIQLLAKYHYTGTEASYWVAIPHMKDGGGSDELRNEMAHEYLEGVERIMIRHRDVLLKRFSVEAYRQKYGKEGFSPSRSSEFVINRFRIEAVAISNKPITYVSGPRGNGRNVGEFYDAYVAMGFDKKYRTVYIDWRDSESERASIQEFIRI